jgi:hypothetical protein
VTGRRILRPAAQKTDNRAARREMAVMGRIEQSTCIKMQSGGAGKPPILGIPPADS